MVFYKDLRGVFKAMLIIPACGLLFAGIFELFLIPFYGAEMSAKGLASAVVMNLGILTSLVAILLGIGTIAEERTAGTDLLLHRLPISQARLYTEKISACVVGLLIMYVGSMLLFSLLDLSEVFPPKPGNIGTIPINFFVTISTSFLFALVFTRLTQHSIAIVFLTLGAEILLWFLIGFIWVEDSTFDLEGTLHVIAITLLFFAAPVIIVWYQWQPPISGAVWGSRDNPTLMRGLIFKSLSESALLYALALGLFLAALLLWVFNPQLPEFNIANHDVNEHSLRNIMTSGFALIIVAALGTNAYVANERHGLHSVTYCHPISKLQLFLSKQITAIPVLVFTSLSCIVTLSDYVSALPVIVSLVCTYQFSLLVSVTTASNTVIVMLGSLSLVCTAMVAIGLWMTPMENALFLHGFVPIHDPTVVASLPLSLLTLGAFFCSWRVTGDRKFLTGTNRFRARYVGICIVYVCAITSVITTIISQVVEL